jgi:hypothetical protein
MEFDAECGSRGTMLHGAMKFQGNAGAKAGSVIELAGVGTRFSGNVMVNSVSHRIGSGDWITEVRYGLLPDTSLPQTNATAVCDDSGSIILQDQSGSRVELRPEGILLSSEKDIVINAKGKITISGSSDVTVSGLNISNTAQVGFTAKGAATAELSASGQTTVKGALVMIN